MGRPRPSAAALFPLVFSFATLAAAGEPFPSALNGPVRPLLRAAQALEAPEIGSAGAVEEKAVEDGSYVGAWGGRAYRLYVPSRLRGEKARAAPLLVMLHGCTHDPREFSSGSGMDRLAEERGFLVLYPEQSRLVNPMGCWQWYSSSDQRRGAGEPAILAGMTRTVGERHPVQAGRIYVAGFSAGAAMADILASAYPDVFSAAALHSGVPYGAASSAWDSLAAMKTPRPERARAYAEAALAAGDGAGPVPRVLVLQGDADRYVAPGHAAVVGEQFSLMNRIAYAREQGAPLPETRPEPESGSVPGGRSYTDRCLQHALGSCRVREIVVRGMEHAWSGGRGESFMDPLGPDASRLLCGFFGL